MADFHISKLAVPAGCLLVTFLAYSSQILFRYLEPGPLTSSQLLYFNLLVGCVWVCFARACLTSPGEVPKDWQPKVETGTKRNVSARPRWCRKCETFKPPRAHHCKTCGR